MKRFITRIINSIKFAWKYLIWANTKRKTDAAQKEAIKTINPATLTSRDKQRLKANKEKIRNGQPTHFNGMVRGFRKLRIGARDAGTKLYLGAKNKQGLREILNGQKDAAGRCEIIVNPDNVHRLKVSHIIESLKKPA